VEPGDDVVPLGRRRDRPGGRRRFRGSNRDGWRRWSTTCTVTAAEPGKAFAFRVAFGPLDVAEWRYDIEAAGDGCVVRESWRDRRAGWFRAAYPVVMGVPDRAEHNRRGMAETLRALKAAAEGA
jgi:uncharacterized protein YndB with AHSA1/START domain